MGWRVVYYFQMVLVGFGMGKTPLKFPGHT